MKKEKIAQGVYLLQSEGELSSNVYVLEGENGKRMLIDAGSGAIKLDFEPEICILTHGHYDHTKGVKGDWERVYLHPAEFAFNGPFIRIPENAKKISFEKFEFGGFSLEVVHTPGHTPGGICIFEKNIGILFSGDTKFAHGGCGRTDLGGSESQLQESLEKIEKIPYKILCPGHGEIEERE